MKKTYNWKAWWFWPWNWVNKISKDEPVKLTDEEAALIIGELFKAASGKKEQPLGVIEEVPSEGFNVKDLLDAGIPAEAIHQVDRSRMRVCRLI